MWHGVFPTNVTHILLGNPWLKEQDAYHDEEAYTYSFTFRGCEQRWKSINVF